MLCLILGGGGFIGSHVVDALLERGHSVRVFDRRNINRRNIAHALSSIELIEGDFLNEDNLRNAVKNVDIVVHLIGTTLPKSSNEDMTYDVETNVVGTIKLLGLAMQEGIRKVVYASSGGTIYGPPQALPVPETHPTEPISSYGLTKLATEKYLQLHHHLYGLDYTVLRISNPYGERQDPGSGQGAVTTFLCRALSNQPITIWGDGSVARDYLYVADLKHAFMRVIENDCASHIYNIGSGNASSLNEILEIIKSVTGRNLDVTYTDGRKIDVSVNCLDNARAKRELGWSPSVSLEDGIALTWTKLLEG